MNNSIKLQPRILLAIIISMVTGIILGITLDLMVHSKGIYKKDQAFHLDMGAFTQIIDRIHTSYVIRQDMDELLENALKGVLNGLDKHSVYLDKKKYSALKSQTTGQFGGVGIELTIENGKLKIVAPLENTPAERAGILPDDILVQVDHATTKPNTLKHTLALLRGEPGTSVTLSIDRMHEQSLLEFDLVRATIDVNSVHSRWLENYGYVRVSQFQVDTSKEVSTAIKTFLLSTKPKMAGLILDLRGNPGGVLQASVELADAFLTSGKIVYTEGRRSSAELIFNATGNDILDGLPLAILIDSGSASASEIVAGALQDHNRAYLMGSKSYGKGSVQTVLPLKNDHAIKLTTAHYFTPLGRAINEVGLTPDIEIKPIAGKKYLKQVIEEFSRVILSKN
ncbi:MAG: S41 family peptidase [Pseudomonadales bacterium]|nr:S41 family peptidase [Pseudomonadales bacterium]